MKEGEGGRGREGGGGSVELCPFSWRGAKSQACGGTGTPRSPRQRHSDTGQVVALRHDTKFQTAAQRQKVSFGS